MKTLRFIEAVSFGLFLSQLLSGCGDASPPMIAPSQIPAEKRHDPIITADQLLEDSPTVEVHCPSYRSVNLVQNGFECDETSVPEN